MEHGIAWLWNALRTAALIVAGAVASLRYNWGIGVLAVVLAVSLWVFVTERANPERTGGVPNSVSLEVVNVPQGLAVCSLSAESVTVRARASESVLDRLTAADFRATIDLADVTGDEVTVAVTVKSEEPRAEVVSFSPAQVRIDLESVTTRTVPVRANQIGGPPRGFEEGEITVEPEEALVTGPTCLVILVDRVTADVNLVGVRTTLDQTVLLQPQNELGGPIRGVNVEPNNATVRAEIEQIEFSQPFIVRPDVRGLPAEGHDVTGIQVDPAVVVVAGPADVLESIDAVRGIETEVVNIDGATADVAQTVALRLPEGARAERTIVTVRVTVAPAQPEETLSVTLLPINTPAGLSASMALSTIEVTVTSPAASPIAADDLLAFIDLRGLEPGPHDLSVVISVPPGVTLIAIMPTQVEVTLSTQ